MKFGFSLFAAAAMVSSAIAATPTLTNTFAPVPTGCGVHDRTLLQGNGVKTQYQVFCNSQPGGYASISGAIYAANKVIDCASYCDVYNLQKTREYTCHAALYTYGDKKCQLLWQANGNISPRSDSDYLVAHNF